MPVQYTRYERRDNADRNEIGLTVLDICRQIKAVEGIQSARFYWPNPDTVTLLVEGTAEGLNAPASAGLYAAVYKLGDLTRTTANERWASAGDGERSYRQAGR